MPPRKKQKTSTGSKAVETTPVDFPAPDLLERALEQYGRAIALRSAEHTKSPQQLLELDAWLADLPGKLASGQPVTKADMTSLMKWKLSRGKSRPTLLALLASNSDALVEKSTTKGLGVVRDAKEDVTSALAAVPHVCALKGVGAATASALLTLRPPHVLPFMSDEAASFFAPTLGAIKYTDAFYAKFARAMDTEVRRLNEGGESWNTLSLERALFAICILRKHSEEDVLEPNTSPLQSTSKRKIESI